MKALILHASAGGGHKRAAEALSKAFAAESPSTSIVLSDILEFTGPVFRNTYADGYLRLVRQVPELWGYLYDQSDRRALQPWRKNVRSVFNKINTIRFRRFFRAQAPDMVLCTHFMPLEMLSTMTREEKTTVPFYGCVTDFAVHALWIIQGVTAFYVATEEARRTLVRRGQPADTVHVTGIPIDPVFGQKGKATDARRKLGLRDDVPAVLILSGGFGVGPTLALIRSFQKSPFKCQLLVVAGANKELQQQAEREASRLSLPARVLGFVNNIHELMDAADVVVSKPGGLTTSEAMAKGLPMLIVDPIPGQEQRNGEYLLEHGAAGRLYEPEDASHKIAAMLGNRDQMARMRQNARQLGRPESATEIVRDVLRRR
jgi:processive 1,2-diacylglycerol beta-glucosyltransferase